MGKGKSRKLKGERQEKEIEETELKCLNMQDQRNECFSGNRFDHQVA
jgi:hypothetical protein